MKDKGDLFVGALLGALVGYGAGILMAPASGAETRKKIEERAERLAQDAHLRGEEFYSKTRASAEDMASRFREGARDSVSRLREKLAEGMSIDEALAEIEKKLEDSPA